MTFTIDQVKQLVPEAMAIEQISDGSIIFYFNGMIGQTRDPWVDGLIATRHQLAIARAALEKIAESNHGSRESAIACKALASIKQAGEEK